MHSFHLPAQFSRINITLLATHGLKKNGKVDHLHQN